MAQSSHPSAKKLTEKKRLGNQAENIAREYLSNKGMSFCMSNFQCKTGEIDLIMKDQDCLVFVEVRYRINSEHGSPLETITLHKQRKLIRTANYFLQQHFQNRWPACRFDAIGIVGDLNHSPELSWISNAFY